MLVTEKRNISTKAQMTTSAYLNSETVPQSTEISAKVNELLMMTPSNPHVKKLWKIKFGGLTIFYANPDNVFHNTSLRKYFKQLLDFQSSSGVIEPKDHSTYKFRKLYAKFKNFLSEHQHIAPRSQRMAFTYLLQKLASDPNISVNDLNIQANADLDLVVFKKTSSGTHYILVGDSLEDISYLHITNSPGVYSSLHVGENVSINNIIDSFSSE